MNVFSTSVEAQHACMCACACIDRTHLSCLSACFLSLPVRLLAAALGDSPAMLTWSRLTLAFLNESCSCEHRLRLKCGSLACVITPLACQGLGTSAVCCSHTELGIVLEYWNISLVHLILRPKKQDLYDAAQNQTKR